MAVLENHAGITITNSKLQLVEIVKKNERFVLNNVDEAYFSETINFNNDREAKISALIQGAINELLIKKTLTANSISFTLPFEFLYMMQIPYESTLLQNDLIEEFRWELSLLYPFVDVNDFVIQFFEIDKNEYSNIDTALVLSTQRKYLRMLDNICNDNGFKLKFVDNAHIAYEKSLAVNNVFADKNLTISVYFNNKNLSVLFSLKGKLIYYKLIPINSVREISEYLKKEINFNKTLNIMPDSIEAAFICSDEITPQVVKSLSEEVGIKFIQSNPFSKIVPDQSLFNNNLYTTKFNLFAPSAGIAYRLS
jgi:Tfp pilus assembly PilM family ATPase